MYRAAARRRVGGDLTVDDAAGGGARFALTHVAIAARCRSRASAFERC
jgi:hypothetical protein